VNKQLGRGGGSFAPPNGARILVDENRGAHYRANWRPEGDWGRGVGVQANEKGNLREVLL